MKEAELGSVGDLVMEVERVASELKAASSEAALDRLLVDMDQLQKQAARLRSRCKEASEKTAVVNLSKEIEEHMSNCVVKKAAMLAEDGNGCVHDVQVACRIRPSKNGTDPSVIPVSRNQVTVKTGGSRGDRRKTFDFSEVFGPESTQEDVFNFVRPLVMSILEGGKVCLCAYGQTGSGKSYTMTGTHTEHGLQKGLYHYSLDEIFNAMQNDNDRCLEIQIIQISNDTVQDLLSVDLKQVSKAGQATRSPVKTVSEAVQLFEDALDHKSAALIKAGGKRLRMHQILTIHVTGGEEGAEPGCLQLVDLPGSERVGRSEASTERLEEAKYINKSLSAVSDAFGALVAKSSSVPLDGSKITESLKPTLGGPNPKAAMVIHIAPEDCFRSESLTSLMFGQRVLLFKDGEESKAKLLGPRETFTRMGANDPSNREREVQMRIAARSAMSEKENMEKDLKALREELNLTRRSLKDLESRSLFRHQRSSSTLSPSAMEGSDSSRSQSQKSSGRGLRTSRSSSAVSRSGMAENMARLGRQRRGIDRAYAPKGRRLSIAFEEPETPGSVNKQLKNVGPAEVR